MTIGRETPIRVKTVPRDGGYAPVLCYLGGRDEVLTARFPRESDARDYARRVAARNALED